MAGFLATFGFSRSATAPIFVILALGVLLRRVGVPGDGFIDGGSKLVFTIALPGSILGVAPRITILRSLQSM